MIIGRFGVNWSVWLNLLSPPPNWWCNICLVSSITVEEAFKINKEDKQGKHTYVFRKIFIKQSTKIKNKNFALATCLQYFVVLILLAFEKGGKAQICAQVAKFKTFDLYDYLFHSFDFQTL